ncbi:ADP-ribose-binding protein [Fervidicoccus fontis]|jgi:O-acetyl-ADP-ribose deacetylase (regulator of RNase III)|uniref:Appr-1-p processing domain protein n=2 Tax=Fervidicoccus fontis TaxID=683846 RepID=I0A1L1_FERFK|nr:ADP-ribose-binding protein [Fervidicoccus fontis]AFH42868.1 Appr-1-p processing domain protein [Fervidicoccus fontis Kam940]MBE9391790.1 ADP-ribose-binding protein [Fervidicoccus fontis]PMB76788.1 MAG: ADP-ribose-binding protein [Fervidicoccus fontis]HEW64472.1 ADP-ribose-binding protein [Fervidicoccus fontis]
MKSFFIKNVEIRLVQGDITELEVDAIANAANSYLEHGGGVALAIVRKGGYIIQKESREFVKKFGPVPTGGVAVTNAGKLKCKYVIHAVGPRFGEENGDKKLASAVASALNKAEELKINSIAFPAISTGIFGYPYERAAEIMSKVFINYRYNSIKLVVMCLYDEEAYRIFEKVFSSIFS